MRSHTRFLPLPPFNLSIHHIISCPPESRAENPIRSALFLFVVSFPSIFSSSIFSVFHFHSPFLFYFFLKSVKHQESFLFFFALLFFIRFLRFRSFFSPHLTSHNIYYVKSHIDLMILIYICNNFATKVL